MDNNNYALKYYRCSGSGDSVIYDFVPLHLVADGIANNIENHSADINRKETYGDANVDWDAYLQLSHEGRCRVTTARENDKLIGYAVFCISRHPNHRDFIHAINTALFIEKKYRGKLTLDLIRKSDKYLEEMGVMETSYTFNDERIGKLIERANYKQRQITWSNRYATFFNTINDSPR